MKRDREIEEKAPGLVAVSRIGAAILPDFVGVDVYSSGQGFGTQLSPFYVKSANGSLIENEWQFAKVYPKVTEQNQSVWKYPGEQHVDANGDTNEAYWKWRKAGMNHTKAVRYPNGRNGRHTCKGAIWPGHDELIGYLDSRKIIYCPQYGSAVSKTDAFQKLQAMVMNGTNVQLFEYDVPKIPIVVTEAVIRNAINDEKHPFGHGYVLAALLLDGGAEWMT